MFFDIQVEVRQIVDADVKKAKSDAEIDIKELYYDVYEHNLQGKLRGNNVWETHEHKKTTKALNAN